MAPLKKWIFLCIYSNMLFTHLISVCERLGISNDSNSHIHRAISCHLSSIIIPKFKIPNSRCCSCNLDVSMCVVMPSSRFHVVGSGWFSSCYLCITNKLSTVWCTTRIKVSNMFDGSIFPYSSINNDIHIHSDSVLFMEK